MSHSLQFLVFIMAGWLNRQQQDLIDYLREENRILREQLGSRGLHLTDEQRRRLAAKTSVFDRTVTFVGSFNLDPRSVNLNTEIGLLVESEALANAVADSIENDIAAGNSWQVILKDDGKVEWITVVDGVVTAETDTEPMTSAARRADAKALALVPDDAEP